MTSVLHIDDHPVVLQGFKLLLEGLGSENIAAATTASAGFRCYRQHKPDVIVLDLEIGQGSKGGLSFLRRLRRIDTETPVLVFTIHSDPLTVRRALKLGATGYALKDAPPSDIVYAFERVRDGQAYLSPELASDVVFDRFSKRSAQLEDLKPRELQVFTLLAEAKSYEEIAEQLDLSYRTIGNTCSRLKRKLGVRTRAELIRFAIQYFAENDKRDPMGAERDLSQRFHDL